jgi:hypothetical protein
VKPLTLLGLFSAAVSSVFASPISVQCGATPSYSSDGLSATCDALDSNYIQTGKAGGRISLSIGLSQNSASGFYSLSEHVETFVFEGRPTNPGSVFGPGWSVSGSIDYSQTFNTGGPARQGYVYLQSSGTHFFSYNGGQALTLGFLNGTLAGVPAGVITEADCSGRLQPCGLNPAYYQNPIPVTLGTDMTLVARSSVGDYASSGDGISGGVGSAAYGFRFTEADGTPVTLIGTPEPSAFTLGAFGLIGLLSLCCRFRKAG